MQASRPRRLFGTAWCYRLECRKPATITLKVTGGAIVAYCTDHAEGHAIDPDTEVLWLAPGMVACLVCGAVVSSATQTDHTNPRTHQPCPPPWIDLASVTLAP